MVFYSSPEAIEEGAELFELMLQPPTAELKKMVADDRATAMWKLAFREKIQPQSAYHYVLQRTLEQCQERGERKLWELGPDNEVRRVREWPGCVGIDMG